MVIDLTNSEKKSFYRFLFTYLGSSFILLFFIAVLYFQNEKTLYFDLVKSNMQNKASNLSSQVVFSHMTSSLFDRNKAYEDSEYQISFYDKKQNKMFGNLDEKIDFSKELSHKDNYLVLVDDSALGHLGVYYIAIKENVLHQKISDMFFDVVIVFIFVYLIISAIGVYLAKLFLKPIKEEREKLNNFIKDTTHELNTPISAIMMSAQSDDLSAKQIQRIKLSANRVSEIYKDLTYVFLENKNKQKDIKNYDLKELIQNQINEFEPLILKKKISLKLDLKSFKYKIDKDDFERLFNNLISNAIKYNKTNGNLEIRLQNNILKVKDTGIGIEKSKINDIYKRYFRATNQNGGFGLGLNIVSIVCLDYNISIDVESELGKETTFILKF